MTRRDGGWDGLKRATGHGEQIAGFYRSLFADIRLERLEPVRRWYGDDHVVDETILHATAVGQVFGSKGPDHRCKRGSCTSSTSATG